MGRMLEALRKSDRTRPQTERSDRAEAPVAARAATESEAEETIPFIEVGGPRNLLEASPDVLACPSSRSEPVVEPAGRPPVPSPSSAAPASLTMSLFCSWNLPAASDGR